MINKYKYRLMGIPVLVLMVVAMYLVGMYGAALFGAGATIGHIIAVLWLMGREDRKLSEQEAVKYTPEFTGILLAFGALLFAETAIASLMGERDIAMLAGIMFLFTLFVSAALFAKAWNKELKR